RQRRHVPPHVHRQRPARLPTRPPRGRPHRPGPQQVAPLLPLQPPLLRGGVRPRLHQLGRPRHGRPPRPPRPRPQGQHGRVPGRTQGRRPRRRRRRRAPRLPRLPVRPLRHHLPPQQPPRPPREVAPRRVHLPHLAPQHLRY